MTDIHTGDFFFVAAPGPWELYQTEEHRRWWYNAATAAWFWEK